MTGKYIGVEIGKIIEDIVSKYRNHPTDKRIAEIAGEIVKEVHKRYSEGIEGMNEITRDIIEEIRKSNTNHAEMYSKVESMDTKLDELIEWKNQNP